MAAFHVITEVPSTLLQGRNGEAELELERVFRVEVATTVTPLQDLNPQGHVYYPDLVAALVEKFNFQVFPTKPEDFNEQTGITFQSGKFEGGTIEQVQIFTHGILLDTRISTDASEELLHDTLVWAKATLGLHYEDNMIKREALVSQLTFESSLSLNKLNPVLADVSKFVTDNLPSNIGQKPSYETTGVVINIDPTASKLTPGMFSIERRAELPFSDNKYFSNAPLSTKDHVAALEELEKALL